jgi:phage protein U
MGANMQMPLSLVMMGLGLFRFGVHRAAYQTLTSQLTLRWAALDRVGRQPARQYLGPGAEHLTLEGVIYPHFKGGLRQVEAMREAAKLGQPFMMVDGLGWVWDRWVIATVIEQKGVFMRDGAPRRIDFQLKLDAYGGDRAGGIGGLIGVPG